MRKQLLACAVLAAAMVPSLAGAAIISIALVEGGGAPVANPGCLPASNNCQLTGIMTGNFTSNVGGLTQPLGNTTLLLSANNITVSAGLG